MPTPEKDQLQDDTDLVQAACYLEDELSAADRELLTRCSERVRSGEPLSPAERERLRVLLR